MKTLKLFLKLFSMILLSGYSLVAFSQATSDSETKFRGNVTIINSTIYVQDEISDTRVKLTTSAVENQKTLSKLKTGDMISGSGHNLIQDQSVVYVDSIEFVGLSNLVGYWSHNTKLFNFVDFSALSIWTMDGGPVPTSQIYKYVLTPVKGNGWRIFVGGKTDGINVGSLDLKDNQAHIILHEPKTHKVIADYFLEKIE